MEGRTIVRPDWSTPPRGGRRRRPLQWRAGQSSGQTFRDSDLMVEKVDPSMEGRTIVRPDLVAFNRWHRASILQWRAGQSSGQTPRRALYGSRRGTPSMEGRTIVRPDHHQYGSTRHATASFNGGPDNRPARPQLPGYQPASQSLLQWRAGQSSGQTKILFVSSSVLMTLQWRAGQSSGQTLIPEDKPVALRRLQWRAGQSSGQTYAQLLKVSTRRTPSMEGRTIVRPDMSSDTITVGIRSNLQWRAGQSSGQTRCPSCLRKIADRPSMEGRTIVRPDPMPVMSPQDR